MKGKRLDHYYVQLDALERFRLVVRGYARGDQAELERLERSCPRRRYSGYDPEFFDRLKLSREFVHVVIGQLERQLGKLQILQALTDPIEIAGEPRALLAVYLDCATDDMAAAAAESAPGERWDEVFAAVVAAARPTSERLLELLARLDAKARQVAAGFAHGFARFSESELELDAVHLFDAWAGPTYTAEFQALLAEQPDAAIANHFAESLTRAWRERLELPAAVPPTSGVLR